MNVVNGHKAYILLYVDDILIACKDLTSYREIRDGIKRKYKIKELGLAKQFLNINLVHLENNRGLLLKQEAYIKKIVEHSGLANSGVKDTPLPTGAVIPKLDPNHVYPYVAADKQAARFVSCYRSAVGAVSYLSNVTRPDIAFASNALSRHNADPQEYHWNFVQHTVKYLNKYQKLGLLLNPVDDILRVYSDSDLQVICIRVDLHHVVLSHLEELQYPGSAGNRVV